MSAKTLKFGGTSLADAENIQNACHIFESSSDNRWMVVSAPGKRYSSDLKVTDLLIRMYHEADDSSYFENTLRLVYQRFAEIIQTLQIQFDLDSEFAKIKKTMEQNPTRSYAASRGEYLNAKIIAVYLGIPFLDSAEMIRFKDNGSLDIETTYAQTKEHLEKFSKAVIPGFYGAKENGEITTFSRGGSDVTGAIIAKCSNSDVYENWTDVDGMLAADPRIVEQPAKIRWITYRELRELSYMGASVLHEDAVFPARKAGIPIHILNTRNIQDPGTMIVAKRPSDVHGHMLTGIAGKRGLSNIQIEKARMNSIVGFGAKVLRILASFGVSYEHTPTSIDTMSVIVETAQVNAVRDEIIEEIGKQLEPDVVFIEDSIALIAVVGEGLAGNVGLAAWLFQVVSEAGINIRMIDVGFSELNIILGIDEKDYETTIRAIYAGMKEAFETK